LEYYAIDILGNNESAPSFTNVHNMTFYVDDTPPTTTLEPINGSYVHTSTIMYLNASDNTCVGITGHYRIHYRIFRQVPTGTPGPPPPYPGQWKIVVNWTVGPWDTNLTFSFTENCTHVVEYYAEDILGNEETHHFDIYYVDVKPPVSNMTFGTPCYKYAGKTFITNYTPIYINATDYGCNGGVGVDTIYYRIWYNGTWTPWMLYDGIPITLEGECIHYLEINATDLLGNTGFDNVTFYVDNSPPISWLSGEMIFDDFIDQWSEFTIFVDDQGECEVGDYTIHFRITGPDGSKFYWFLDYYNCNGTWHTGFHSIPVSFQLRNEEGYAPRGIYTVEFWAEDDLGNAESPHNIEELKVDTVAPETTLSLNGPVYESTNVWISYQTQIVLTANDEDL